MSDVQTDRAIQEARGGLLPREMEALRLVPTPVGSVGEGDGGGANEGREEGERAGPRLQRAVVPVPVPTRPDEVCIEVLAAGLCRTDLYVASGALPASPGLILGHEGAGRIAAKGQAVETVALGDFVGIDPRIACGRCHGCSPPTGACLAPQRLGVERDGVFAGFVVIPAANAIPLARSVSPQRGAYLEPVAAAMGALRAGLSPEDRGAIAGDGRIAELTRRVLIHAGFPPPPVMDASELCLSCAPAGLDFVIDAGLPDDAALDAMVGALRPGGTLVLKSRSAERRSFHAAAWVTSEITVAARAYGSFTEAAAALADPSFVLEDLFGPLRPLAEYEAVFAKARESEARKLFFG